MNTSTSHMAYMQADAKPFRTFCRFIGNGKTYYPMLGAALRNAPAGLLLGHLFTASAYETQPDNRSSDLSVEQTERQLLESTGLTSDELKSAVDLLTQAKLLNVSVHNEDRTSDDGLTEMTVKHTVYTVCLKRLNWLLEDRS